VTTTTSTTPDHPCGDGVTGPDEECDFRDPQFTPSCCTSGCRFVRVTTPCGDDTNDVCDHADTCDGQGHCRDNREVDTFVCRPEGALGPCDAGDTCDGQNPECPTGGRERGCSVEVDALQAGTGPLVVKCTSRPTPNRRTTLTCEAVGTEGETGRAQGAVAAAAGPRRVVKRTRRVLQVVDDAGNRQAAFRVKLTPLGQRLLHRRRRLPVDLVVVLKQGKTALITREFSSVLNAPPGATVPVR
jgi:hypothetical protein